MSMAAIQIVRSWLDGISHTVANKDINAHMHLVSHGVRVTGIPRIPYIDYHGWRQRRTNEFHNKLLQSLTYRLNSILSEKDDQILFTVEETMKSNNGRTIVIEKKVMLQKEEDGVWRVHRERFDRIYLPLPS